MTRRVTVYLALGANLGDREANLREAMARLRARVAIDRVSSIYETAPVGYAEQPDFLNAVCRGRTDLSPDDLLAFVKGIERSMGRVERFRNAPRPIDIDILLYGRLVLDKPGLTIPHPRMHQRAFVLAPLAEVAPRVRHPVLGKTASQLLREVDSKGIVRRGETSPPSPSPSTERGWIAGRRDGGEVSLPSWTELSATVTPELVEPLTELFNRHGNAQVAIEEREGAVTLRAYLRDTAAGRRRRARVDAGLALLGLIQTIPEVRERRTSERDVADALKEHFTLLRIGRRLVVKPIWQEYEPKDNEIVIALDPGASFGTGHHPTTRLCLEAIERYVRSGWRVLDVGTGSGVLAIAAAALSAADVLGLDTDPSAVRTARRNVRVNRLTRRVRVIRGTLPSKSVLGFDVVVANLVAHIVEALAPALHDALAPGGVLIASGVLKEQREGVLHSLHRAGFRLTDERADGDWLAFVLAGR